MIYNTSNMENKPEQLTNNICLEIPLELITSIIAEPFAWICYNMQIVLDVVSLFLWCILRWALHSDVFPDVFFVSLMYSQMSTIFWGISKTYLMYFQMFSLSLRYISGWVRVLMYGKTMPDVFPDVSLSLRCTFRCVFHSGVISKTCSPFYPTISWCFFYHSGVFPELVSFFLMYF